jgi:hypothetical protein
MASFINAGISSQRTYNVESLTANGDTWGTDLLRNRLSINEGAVGPFRFMDVPVYPLVYRWGEETVN